MIYVILFRSPTGDQWVGNVTGSPLMKDTRDQARQFVRVDSAIRRIKKLRLDGHERNGEFSIEVVEYTPKETIDVPRPKPKVGFVLMQINTAGNQMYYAGHKTESITEYKIQHFLNIERASFFRDGVLADRRLQEMKAWVNAQLDSKRQQAANMQNGTSQKYNHNWHFRNLEQSITKLERNIVELNATHVVHIQ